MRTLGRFHIDERQSLTQLRTILRGFLSDGLKKATKASVAEAMRAEQEAEAARAAGKRGLPAAISSCRVFFFFFSVLVMRVEVCRRRW